MCNSVKMVTFLKKYINTYTDQITWKSFSTRCVVDDIIYGLGLAFDKTKYQGPDGFSLFKNILLVYLIDSMTIKQIISLKFNNKYNVI